ncbi:MAG: type II secretion system protein [Lentisphaerae bacterium]|nr:type II secretion system protein [Lentisphaerota bacterium]
MKRKNAFSLIETLISLAILAILGLAILDTDIFSDKLLERANRLRQSRSALSKRAVTEYFQSEDENIPLPSNFECYSEPVKITAGNNTVEGISIIVTEHSSKDTVNAFLRSLYTKPDSDN